MTAASMRQEVVANNIANVNTPNYRKKNVELEDLLAREIRFITTRLLLNLAAMFLKCAMLLPADKVK